MVRVKISVVNFMNVCSAILCLIVIVWSLCVYYAHDGRVCRFPALAPLVMAGYFLAAVLVLSVLVHPWPFCWHVNSITSTIYLIFLFFVIAGYAICSGSFFGDTQVAASKAVPGIGFKEYHLGDYSNFLKDYVVSDEKDWNKIMSVCLIKTQVCSSLSRDYHDATAIDFYKENLSPAESGCCKPPIECGFEHQNATFWTVPASGAAVHNSDCFAWRNQQETLCYHCNSCKAGVLENIRDAWRKLAIANLCVAFFLFVMWTVLLWTLEIESDSSR